MRSASGRSTIASDCVILQLRSGTADDVESISAVLIEAAEWLNASGRSLWDVKDLSPDKLIDDVRSGSYLVGAVNGRVVGTIRFQLSDPIFWPDVSDGEAAYVHKLAVARTLQKSGLSLELLRFAAQRASEIGRPLLRLDCVADRTRLRYFYEQAGFYHHSDRQCGPYFVARYQMQVASCNDV